MEPHPTPTLKLASPMTVAGPRHYPKDAARNAACRLSYQLILAHTSNDHALSLLHEVFDASGLLTSEDVVSIWRTCVSFAVTPVQGNA